MGVMTGGLYNVAKAAAGKQGGSSGGGPRVTDDMLANAEVSVKRWNDYTTRLRPLEQKFLAAKTGQDLGALKTNARGAVNADTAQALGGAPGNPQQLMKSALSSTDAGRRIAGGMVDATETAAGRKAAELGGITAHGRGQEVGTLAAMSDLAGASAKNSIAQAKSDQDARFADLAATNKLIGSGMNALATGAMYADSKGMFDRAPEYSPAYDALSPIPSALSQQPASPFPAPLPTPQYGPLAGGQ